MFRSYYWLWRSPIFLLPGNSDKNVPKHNKFLNSRESYAIPHFSQRLCGWAWFSLAADTADIILPGVCFLREGSKALRAVAKNWDEVCDAFKGLFKTAKKADTGIVDDAANQVGVDRKGFGNYIHELKKEMNMRADPNFTYQELIELAEEYKEMTE